MSLGSREKGFDGAIVPSHVPFRALHPPQDPLSASIIPKRLKACLGCRELKLRCQRNERSPGLGCDRCVKARRECIIPAGKKRPKRAGSTTAVAALEQKIDALVASLGEMKKDAEDVIGDGLRQNSKTLSRNERFEGHADVHRAASKSGSLQDHNSGPRKSTHSSFFPPETVDKAKKRIRTADPNLFTFFMPRPGRTAELFQTDVINRGLLSLEDAERSFQRFSKAMLPHFPLIKLTDDTTVSTLRKTKPALFLSIIGAASSILGREIQDMLMKEVNHNYADRIIMRGERDLDLIQALQVSVLWYFPPEHYEEVKMFQFVHIATVMAVELGFCQDSKPFLSRLSSVGVVLPGQMFEHMSESWTVLERQRTWLVCYYLCGIVSMTGRRPNMLRWAPYMDQCLANLESSPDKADSDKLLCQFIRGQHIAEEIGQQFCMDDPSAKIDILDVKVQYVLRGLEQQVYRWRRQIPPEVHKPTLQCSVDIISLYLHEIVLHVGHNINDFRPPFTEESLAALMPDDTSQKRTPTQQNSLIVCIMSVKNLLDTFLAFDIETICSIPMVNFVRTAYAAIALIKIYLMALRSKDDLFGIIDKDDLQVEQYLDRLTAKMYAAKETGLLRIASIFHFVLEMLSAWFRSQCLAVSGLDHDISQKSDQTHAGWTGHPGASRSKNVETPSCIDKGRPISDTIMQLIGDETTSSSFGSGLSYGGNDEEADLAEMHFTNMFYSDDRSLFESAFGWLGGFA